MCITCNVRILYFVPVRNIDVDNTQWLSKLVRIFIAEELLCVFCCVYVCYIKYFESDCVETNVAVYLVKV